MYSLLSGRIPDRFFKFSLYLLAGAVIFKSFNQLDADYDLWWHILLGRDLLLKGNFHHFDVFSFTANGQAMVNHGWLSDMVLAGVYRLGGDTGLILLRWSILVIMLCLVLRIVRRETKDAAVTVICLLCFAVVLRPGVSFRPLLFSYLFLLLLMGHLHAARRLGHPPSIWKASILFCVWANLHGGFVLGLVVWFVDLIGRGWHRRSGLNWKAFCPGILLPVIATLINPYGFALWGYILEELSNPLNSAYITEWRRFAFEPRESAFLFLSLLAWGLFFGVKVQKTFEEASFLLLSTVMGLLAVRNTPFFIIMNLTGLACRLSLLIHRASAAGPGVKAGNFSVGLTSLLLVGASFLFIKMGFPERWEIRLEKDPLPTRAVAFLKINQFSGNLWVPLHWGGYAIYHLHPDMRVSIDGRWAMVYPREVMRDNMSFAYDGGGGKWKEILEKYKADLALIETGNRALAEVGGDSDWIVLYKDRDAVLASRKDYLTKKREPLKLPSTNPATWP